MTATVTEAVTTRGSARRPRSGPPRTPGWIARRGLLYATLVVLLLVFVFPLLWALSGSFKRRGDIFSTPPTLVPSPATGENYVNLLTTQPFWAWFGISVGTAVIATVVSVFVCAMAGYGFAKFRFRGSGSCSR